MFLAILCGFFGLVLYQTVAKKTELPLISDGLVAVQDICTGIWENLGIFMGKCLNIVELWDFFKMYMILLRIWDNIKPFFESILEITVPVLRIVYSWMYFFIGFSKAKYVIFSYIGGTVVVTILGYYTREYWMPLQTQYGEIIIVCIFPIFIGACVVYWNEISTMSSNIIEISRKRTERRNELSKLTKKILIEMYGENFNLNTRDNKYEIINSIINGEFRYGGNSIFINITIAVIIGVMAILNQGQ